MPRESAIHPAIGGQCRFDALIAELAARQHGVVGRAQLLELGLGRRAIDHRVEHGRLHVLHRGVYAVGHRIVSREGRWMAAVLAAGDGAVLSHDAAAAFLELRPSSARRIGVTVPGGRRSRPGIKFHRTVLPADEVITHRGIPVTTPSRTILDLAGELPLNRLERAISELERLRLPDPVSLHELLTRHPRSRGSKSLRQILRDFAPTLTRRELEHRFLQFIDVHGLPRPEINASLVLEDNRHITPDCLWLGQRLIVELDGRDTHARRRGFEADRARDRAATVAGYKVVRITWRQLRDEPSAIAADLSALLLRAV